MPIDDVATAPPAAPHDQPPPSDPKTIPRGKAYRLALDFNKKRPGIAAFSWVAVWRGNRGPVSRSFPLDAHGFDEALRGAAATVLLETGLPVPADELEMASYKVRRVNEYLRTLALNRAQTEVEGRSPCRS